MKQDTEWDKKRELELREERKKEIGESVKKYVYLHPENNIFCSRWQKKDW